MSGTTHTIESTLGEIFRTDLAQALLLDTHVDVPGKIWTSDAESNLAINAAQSVFGDNGLTIPSIMSRNHDLQLIAAFMEARLETRTAAHRVGRVGAALLLRRRVAFLARCGASRSKRAGLRTLGPDSFPGHLLYAAALEDAKQTIEGWRRGYNRCRSHGSMRYLHQIPMTQIPMTMSGSRSFVEAFRRLDGPGNR